MLISLGNSRANFKLLSIISFYNLKLIRSCPMFFTSATELQNTLVQLHSWNVLRVNITEID